MAILTEKQIEKMATEIRDFLLKKSCWIDTRIYFNGKCFSTDDGQGNFFYNDKRNLITLEDKDMHDITVWCGDDILMMTFEGPLYDILNGTYDFPQAWDGFTSEFEQIFKKYGCYYELGDAWNLAAAYL